MCNLYVVTCLSSVSAEGYIPAAVVHIVLFVSAAVCPCVFLVNVLFCFELLAIVSDMLVSFWAVVTCISDG